MFMRVNSKCAHQVRPPLGLCETTPTGRRAVGRGQEGGFTDTLTIYKGESIVDNLGIVLWVNPTT